MTTVTVATTIAAPTAPVLAVFADFEHWSERVSNIRAIEMLTTGGFELGTRWLKAHDVLNRDLADLKASMETASV